MKTLLYLILGLSLAVTTLNAQTVTTFTEGTPDDAIAIDNNGNIYCSNYTGDTVFKFTPTGDSTPFVTGLNTPNGLAFNSQQELYVCDGQANTIYKFDINGNQLASYSITGHPSGIIKSPGSDTMIFTLYVGNKMYELSPSGDITEISSDANLNGPVGLAYNEAGDLFVGNFTDRKVFKVQSNGDLDYIATVGASSDLGFIAYAHGRLWGTVMGEHKIYTINPNATDDVALYAGSTLGTEDGDLTQATFRQPNGIHFNNTQSTMYITDFGSKNLRIISDVTLGVSELSAENLAVTIAPNPVDSILNVNFKNTLQQQYTIEVYDVLGKLLLKKEVTKSIQKVQETLNVSSLSKGSYLLHLNINNQIITRKFLK